MNITHRHQSLGGREVISSHPVSTEATDRPPILMVHGVCHGAWCWQRNFLPFFATRGWHSYAVTLRGHTGGAARDDVSRLSLADYVDDVAAVANQLPSPPVLIGHSMGGMVVQKYLETRRAAAAVLLASMPPKGALRSPVIRRHPLLLLEALLNRSVLELFSTSERCRALFFSEATADEIVLACLGRLTEESNRAVLDLILSGSRRRPANVSIPMLVVGARNDGMFSPAQVELTATHYGADALIMSNTGHNIMMEPTWPDAADYIESWLRRSIYQD